MALITIAFTLAAVLLMLTATYLHRLAELTRPVHAAKRRGLEQSCAVGVLKQIDDPSQAVYRRYFSKREFRQYSYDFMRSAMPLMFDEAQRAMLASRSLLAALHFGFFCLAYGGVWVKVGWRAHTEDLRYLAGAELPLLRRVGLPSSS